MNKLTPDIMPRWPGMRAILLKRISTIRKTRWRHGSKSSVTEREATVGVRAYGDELCTAGFCIRELNCFFVLFGAVEYLKIYGAGPGDFS